ncbi:unnamed protein product [Polarella glacialis]|uniref:Amino acid transporter transmembrane domain-containing protein n=1 Tax=Polarella glacialis TaxID=89957 RepID=A0A813K021_POLGL|nr:unnamed protein product [Polarella glacialis]
MEMPTRRRNGAGRLQQRCMRAVLCTPFAARLLSPVDFSGVSSFSLPHGLSRVSAPPALAHGEHPVGHHCGSLFSLRLRPSPAVAAVAGAEVPKDGSSSGTTASAASLNLAKNLAGSGILSLPAGVAAFSSSPAALGPALLMLLVAAVLSTYSFYLIGEVCEDTESSSWSGAWEKSVKKGKWVPQLVVILQCFGGAVVYAMVIGDLFSSLLQGLGFLPAIFSARSTVIAAISAVVLYPLCCLRSFGPLAKFSLLGTVGTSYVVMFVTKRFFDGSYAAGGAFYQPLVASAAVKSSMGLVNPQMLVLISILSTAFLVHFNAPQFYSELRPARFQLGEKEKGEKLQRFIRMSMAGFGIASLQYALVMAFGFLTFGQASTGNVLLNYSGADSLAVAARAAIGFSCLFGYPMQFAGFRDGILEVFGKKDLPKVAHRLVTAGLLACAAGAACVFRDLGQFQALEGALLASFLIFAAPPIMALQPSSRKRSRLARMGLRSLIVLGTVVGCIGGAVSFGWL